MTEDCTEKLIEGLYETLYTPLVRWCRLMTGDLQTAEELVQEAFLRALLHGEVLAGLAESQQRAWFYHTIKNLYVDRVRRGKWEMTVDRFPESQAEHEASEALFMVEWGELLTFLPGLERHIFVLRYLHGYTSEQIGKMMHMPAGTVRSKLHDARKRLRQLIGQR